jgi:NIMA (never in mitosis gene a)-related kinase 1/4/5
MDYADGGDLQTKVQCQRNYFPEFQIIDWFTQICLAIKYIHDRKIIHRDLKSQNIFLMRNNTIKLGDFGIAKCLSYTLEQAQTITGTPYYLSPEIVQSKPYSFKSDIWSLGILLYEMCALNMPFNADNLPKLSLNIIKGQFSQIPSHYSKDLKLLVSSLLQVDQDKRPSVNEILNMAIIKKRIKQYLSEMKFNSELSNTIIRNKFNQIQSVFNEQSNTEDNGLVESYDGGKTQEPKYFYLIKSPSNERGKISEINKLIKINATPENKKTDLKNIKNVLEKHKYVLYKFI